MEVRLTPKSQQFIGKQLFEKPSQKRPGQGSFQTARFVQLNKLRRKRAQELYRRGPHGPYKALRNLLRLSSGAIRPWLTRATARRATRQSRNCYIALWTHYKAEYKACPTGRGLSVVGGGVVTPLIGPSCKALGAPRGS